MAAMLSLGAFLPGIHWGLPSRAADPYLFGQRTPWTGQQILELAGGLDAQARRGADVDANPLDRSAGPVTVNAEDQQRAEIVRRFRLFSHQPDEFINFAALAGMAQRRDLDPRLYQYGGLWLYPLGGLLETASRFGYLPLTGDLAFYLEDPGQFARFYVVARLYSVFWGAVGVAVVYVLVRRLTASHFAAFCGGITFALLPVVVNAAHEAKPHLAGAVLMLWAVLKADDYVRTGRRRDAVLAGVLCGASSAMVISMIVSFAVVPVMGLLRWRMMRGGMDRSGSLPPAEAGSPDRGVEHEAGSHDATSRRGSASSLASAGLLALAGGFLVYAISNPYVLYNLLFDRAIFQSNIENSTAMYQQGSLMGGLLDGVHIMGLAIGYWLYLAIGAAIVLFVIFGGLRRVGERLRGISPTGWLLTTAAVAVLVYFLPLSAGKPPEYARFGIVPAAALLAVWFVLVGRVRESRPGSARRPALWLLAPILAAGAGVPYVVNFIADSGPTNTRLIAAQELQRLESAPGDVLHLRFEPAPWSGPPFDLWHWMAVLDEQGQTRPAVAVRPLDAYLGGPGAPVIRGRFVTPISWANKPILVQPPRRAAE